MKTDPRTACQRKRDFTKRKAFEMAAHEAKKGNFITAYRCPCCGKYHLTKIKGLPSNSKAFRKNLHQN